MRRSLRLFPALVVACAGALLALPAAARPFTLEEVLSAPYPTGLVAAKAADRIAWVENDRGVRNVWTAAAPGFEPVKLTSYAEDDGQEISGLALTPDGAALVYVRGGEPNDKKETPNPTSDPHGAEQAIWVVPTDGSAPPRRLAAGAGPVLSPTGDHLIFVDPDRQDRVMEVPLAPVESTGANDADTAAPGDASQNEAPPEAAEAAHEPKPPEPEELFQARGSLGGLAFSPDGSRVLFTSDRGDHGFVGVYDRKADAIHWIAPSVDRDGPAVWSPDGSRIAFVRFPGRRQGELLDLIRGVPFSLWVADAATGEARELWRSPGDDGGFAQYYPNAPLRWPVANRILFTSEHEGWLHVDSLDPLGSKSLPPADLTPGACEAEATALTPDHRTLVVSSNCGDIERRHLWRVPVAGGAPEEITSGLGVETDPQVLGGGALLAYRAADARRPQAVTLARLDGSEARRIAPELPPGFPLESLVVPEVVTFQSSDGLTIHGQLFRPPPASGSTSGAGAGASSHPALVFMHGGPIRQMLPAWHYMAYYADAYAMNQYLASRGYVVLSVNYRSGIGYGRDFRRAPHQGPRGASEYHDVLAAGKYLRDLPGVAADRIGLWGGSYGGYLTALALARNSDLFAAGVDLHGVHDWAFRATHFFPGGAWGITDDLLDEAHASSPVADLSFWSSPVLLIQGDDDSNVLFSQTVDLAQRLRERKVHVETLVFPDEIHDFLRHETWLRTYRAAADFFARMLDGGP